MGASALGTVTLTVMEVPVYILSWLVWLVVIWFFRMDQYPIEVRVPVVGIYAAVFITYQVHQARHKRKHRQAREAQPDLIARVQDARQRKGARDE